MKNIELKNTITFNGSLFRFIAIHEKARNHYQGNSELIFQEMTMKLDNQQRLPDEYNKKGEELFHLASNTSFFMDNHNLFYRDTMFKIIPENQTILFFHGSPRRKEQYDV